MNYPNQKNKIDQFIDSMPLKGSLGVLALGAVGVIAWRKKREAAGVSMMQGNEVIQGRESEESKETLGK